LMVTLIVSASLVSQKAATATFCACINGEELSTAVTASCTEWHGTSNFSCPSRCRFAEAVGENYTMVPGDWRESWGAGTFCGVADVYISNNTAADVYTCEPTVACCVAFMDDLEDSMEGFSGDHFSVWFDRTGSSTVEEYKSTGNECSGWITDLFITTFFTFGYNMFFGMLIDYLFFKGPKDKDEKTKKYCQYGGVVLCVFLILGGIGTPAYAAVEATAYGDPKTGNKIIMNWGISTAINAIFLSPLSIGIAWFIGMTMAGKKPVGQK